MYLTRLAQGHFDNGTAAGDWTADAVVTGSDLMSTRIQNLFNLFFFFFYKNIFLTSKRFLSNVHVHDVMNTTVFLFFRNSQTHAYLQAPVCRGLTTQ